jgi:hypothetical protein
MNKQIARESVYRHRSERLIDRILMRVEKKQVEELKAKLQDIERRQNKRQKTGEPEKDLKGQQEQEMKALREKYAGVDHY